MPDPVNPFLSVQEPSLLGSSRSDFIESTQKTQENNPYSQQQTQAIKDQDENYYKNTSNFFDEIAPKVVDQYASSKLQSYDPGYKGTNFERYYSHPLYDKLKFSPFRDNESLYNENSSWFQDFRRMTHQWAGLAWTGARSMNPISNPFDTSADLINSEDMTRRMAVGASSKSGFGAGLTNFAMNTAYTVGVAGALAGETLALAAITAGTEGIGFAPALVKMGSSVTRAGKLVSGLGKSFEALSSIKNVDDAKRLFDLSRAGESAANIAKGFGKWINPLEHTTELLKTTKAWDELGTLAKASKSGVTLWRDLMGIRATTSESRLEGGMTYTKVKEDLINQFFTENARLPNADEGKTIGDRAQLASKADIYSNIPLIFLTNKIVLEDFLRGPISINRLLKESTKGIEGRIVKGAAGAEVVGDYSWRGLKDALKPSTLLSQGLKYTSKNFTEGFQESAQDVISVAATDYYEQPNLDPGVIGHKAMSSSIYDGVKQQGTSQGLETFLSGFAMGGFLGPAGRFVVKTIPQFAYKTAASINPQGKGWVASTVRESGEKYVKYQKQKEDWTNQVVNSWNEVATKPLMAIRALDINFASTKTGSEEIAKAFGNGDIKSGIDAQDQSIFHHVFTLMQAGRTDFLKDQIEGLKQMSIDDLANAFELPANSTTEEKQALYDRLDSFSDRIDSVEKHKKYIDDNFTNPFPANSPVQEIQNLYKSFEYAKMLATFNFYDVERATQRMDSILNSLSASRPLQDLAFSNFSVITNSQLMENELDSLKDEIKIYRGSIDKKNQKLYKDKQEKRDALKDLRSNIIAYKNVYKKSSKQVSSKKKQDSSLEESTKHLYESYKNYLKTISGESKQHLLEKDIADSFSQIKDYFSLEHDSKISVDAINILMNQDVLKETIQRTSIKLAEAQTQQLAKRKLALAEYLRRKEKNDLLNAIYDVGAYITPEDIDALAKNNTPPDVFYNIDTHLEIDPKSEQGQKLTAILEEYNIISKQEVLPLEPEVVPVSTEPIIPITQQSKITILTPINELPVDLKDQLVNAFKTWNNERNVEQKVDLGTKTNEQISGMEAFKNFFIGPAKIKVDVITKYNREFGRTLSPQTTIQVPLIITRGMENKLMDLGYSILEINKLTPEQANDILNKNTVKNLQGVLIAEIEGTIQEDSTIYEERISNAKNYEELDKISSDFGLLLYNPDILNPVNADLFHDLLERKKQELALAINFDDIFEGEVIIMKDRMLYGSNGMAIVVGKTSGAIQVRRFGIPSGTVRNVQKDDLKKEIDFKYNKGMEEVDLTPQLTKDEKELTDQSKENIHEAEGENDVPNEIPTDEELERLHKQSEEDFKDDAKKC